MGLLTLRVPFSVQAFVSCSAWGMKWPTAGAYRRITPQKLRLPLFSALSLHIKPPWCHCFIVVTKRKASSGPSSAGNQNWYEPRSFMWGCDTVIWREEALVVPRVTLLPQSTSLLLCQQQGKRPFSFSFALLTREGSAGARFHLAAQLSLTIKLRK